MARATKTETDAPDAPAADEVEQSEDWPYAAVPSFDGE